MSLESIVEYILAKAETEAQDIIKKAREEAQDIIRQAKQEAEGTHREILDNEKAAAEKERQRLIVNARLDGKKMLLQAKQAVIDDLFKDLRPEIEKARPKKQQVSHQKTEDIEEDIDFYLNRVRADYESDLAKIIFS